MVYFPSLGGVKVIPGSNFALVYGSKAWMMSMINYQVLGELNVPNASDVFISPDSQKAYLVAQNSANQVLITKLNLDGTMTTIEDQEVGGGCRCYYQYTNGDIDITTTSALSPDGTMLLIGNNDPTLGYVVNIYDTESLGLLASVPVPTNCIYGYAFTDDSKRVIAMGLVNQAPIIYLDGESSYLENLFTISNGSFSADYNPVDGLFYVLDRNNYIYKVDPLTGEIRGTLDTYDEHNYRIEIDNRGIPLVLTLNSMFYDGVTYPMPGPATELFYDSDNDLFVTPVRGPDWICVFNPLYTGIQQFKSGQYNEVTVFPNPATDKIVITSPEKITGIKICSMTGTEVFSGNFNEQNIELPAGRLAPGIYLVEITTRSGKFLKKVVVR
jgi:hypothetical protein